MDANNEAFDDDPAGSSIPLEDLVASTDPHYAEIIDSALVGIVHVTLEGLLIRANPFLCEMTGFSTDDLLAMRVDDLITIEAQGADSILARFVRDAEGEVTFEALCSCKDGNILPVSVQGALVRGIDDAPVYGVMIIDPLASPEP